MTPAIDRGWRMPRGDHDDEQLRRIRQNKRNQIDLLLTNMSFEWDSNKARSNWWKHQITFEEAVSIFADPN